MIHKALQLQGMHLSIQQMMVEKLVAALLSCHDSTAHVATEIGMKRKIKIAKLFILISLLCKIIAQNMML